MSLTRRRVARKRQVACGGYCPPIEPGEVYLEHVAFPGEDAMDGATRPWRIRECAACATRYGRGDQLGEVPGVQGTKLAYVPTGPAS